MDHEALRSHRLVVAEKDFLRCAITALSDQGTLYRLDNPATREAQLRDQVRRWAVDGVHIVQLREKQLESGEMYQLACAALEELRRVPGPPGRTRLLLNGRADIAAAAGADGVHLTSHPGDLSPAQVRAVFRAAGCPHCLVSRSCHTLADVSASCDAGADLILFGPVFEKRVRGELVVPGSGLDRLGQACALAGKTPVLALGGITPGTIPACLHAGAAGIAGIRLFRTRSAH